MPIVNANKTLTDELDIGRKLTVVVSSGGSVSVRLSQGSANISATQLASGSSTDFGPFLNTINYAVDCYSGFATTTESQPTDTVGVAKNSITSNRATVKTDDSTIAANNTSTNYTITVVADTISNGLILQQLSTGTVTVAAGSGVTFIGATLATSSAGQQIVINPTPIANTFNVKVA